MAAIAASRITDSSVARRRVSARSTAFSHAAASLRSKSAASRSVAAAIMSVDRSEAERIIGSLST
eukprot:2514166-Prymnesium_polylepis.1